MAIPKHGLTREHLQSQVTAYLRSQSEYRTYAAALKRVLQRACTTAFPDTVVQAREKSVTSFAEKAARKFDKYPDPIRQMTDLCAARVIVQTLEQVRAVRQFIEANFLVLEADEKGLHLGEDKFGYRDMHYIVRLRPDRASILGFKAEELAEIGGKPAEIQIRTWVQHAWADTLHDRIYKARLRYPAEFRRAGALLAAIMEDGDRAFDRLAGDIDAMLADFNAYAAAADVERELTVQGLILATAEDHKKPEIALRIAQLLGPRGDYPGVIEALRAYAETPSPLGDAIRLELGHALCRLHRGEPASETYRQGQSYLQAVVDHCGRNEADAVLDLRQRTGALARALARLAWTYEASEGGADRVHELYRRAMELVPSNPYYMTDAIGYEIGCARMKDIPGAMVPSLRTAIRTCKDHIQAGTEMPYAALSAGRLHLLLREIQEALGSYSRGIRHVLTNASCMPPDVLQREETWLSMVARARPLFSGNRWAMDLLHIAGGARRARTRSVHGSPPAGEPVLIVAGGVKSMAPGQEDQLRPLLIEAFNGYSGIIISGGTRHGVPGCVGDAADAAGARGQRKFRLLGYLPKRRPADVLPDDRYDEWVECGDEGFTPEQILRHWEDLAQMGVAPGQVRLLGFGGGPLSAIEYRIALGLGACVGLIEGSGGAAEHLLRDPMWHGSSNLISLPCDRASVRAFAHPLESPGALNPNDLEKMGMAFHELYVSKSTRRLPDNMRPWHALGASYRRANLEQAAYTLQILEACGFKAVPVPEPDVNSVQFTEEEVERMAELEHGRWNIERLCDGWRHGPRDDARRLHNCLVSWADLPDGEQGVRQYDREAVRHFPAILAKAGMEIRPTEARATGNPGRVAPGPG